MSHRPRKRFGQNFLHDDAIIQRIVDYIAPKSDQHLVEIGPGQAALTRPLLEACGHLDAVEIDRDLAHLLRQQFGGNSKFQLHEADALKFDFRNLRQGDEKLRVIGNLPYNISTPLLFHLTTQVDAIQDMHVMLQKEVVDRMAAAPGSRTYGRLSVMLQIAWQVTPLFTIGPGAFRPPPKVDSSIVRLTAHTAPPVEIIDQTHFAQVVAQAFSQRRKTLRKSLKVFISEQQLLDISIEPTLRPEMLDLEGFARISNATCN